MSTQSEIARLAKTSLKTVSRVINKDPLVNSETRARIEAIITEHGYTPNQAARMMRSQKSNIIGFLADKVATSSSSIELIRGAQDVAWERGKQMMLLNIDGNGDSRKRADAQLAEFRAEAIIYAAVYHQEVQVEPGDVPHVLLNCFEASGRHATVLPDDYQLGYDLTAEILRRGYRRPVFLNLAASIPAGRLRAEGFVAAARDAGLDVAGRVHVAATDPAEGGKYHEGDTYMVDKVLPPLFADAEPPDIVICGHDLMALPVYFTLHTLGREVGKDIAVASFDNLLPLARLLEPGLSTMELPYYEMGRAAMLAAIDGPTDARAQLIPGSFIARASL